MSLDLKHSEASFSPKSIDSLCLRVAQMPTSRSMAIFMLTTTTDNNDDDTTEYITPCACVWGNNPIPYPDPIKVHDDSVVR